MIFVVDILVHFRQFAFVEKNKSLDRDSIVQTGIVYHNIR
jgi:hypothetical protein